ncbi:hypothetical protein D1872_330080 [compost metagenome]
MKVMVPSSMWGRNTSCWLLLKRCTSSTKRMVRTPRQLFSFALSMAARISLMPEVTAESRSTSAWQ